MNSVRASRQAAFTDIQRRAVSGWEVLQQRPRVLVGAATCGRAAGAMDVVQAFQRELDKRKADIPVTQVGCIGLCYAEPLVVIIKPGEFNICYANVSPDLVSRLVDGYVLGD